MSGSTGGAIEHDQRCREAQVAEIGRTLWEGMPKLASCTVVDLVERWSSTETECPLRTTTRRAELTWRDGIERWEPHLTREAVFVGTWPLIRGCVDVPPEARQKTAGWMDDAAGRRLLPPSRLVADPQERRIVWRTPLGVDEWSVPFSPNGPRLKVRHGRVVGDLVDELVMTGWLTWRSVHDQGMSWREVTSSADVAIAGWADAARRAIARWGP